MMSNPAAFQAHAPPSPDAVKPLIAVGLAERHETMRSTLRQVLDSEHDIQTVFEASDIDTLMSLLAKEPHVLVLDASICRDACAATLARVLKTVPTLPIVGITMQVGALFAQNMIDSGAMGVVLKDRADDDLPHAVRAVACGRTYLSRQLRIDRDGADARCGRRPEGGCSPSERRANRLSSRPDEARLR